MTKLEKILVTTVVFVVAVFILVVFPVAEACGHMGYFMK